MLENRQGYQPIARGGNPLPPPCCEDGLCPKCSAADSTQLAIPGIPPPPPPPPPEQYLLAQIRDAYLILQRLSVSFESKLPNNVYMALAHLHIEIIARSTPATASEPAAREVA